MGIGYKKDGGFDRRTSGGKTLDTAGGVVGNILVAPFAAFDWVKDKITGEDMSEEEKQTKFEMKEAAKQAEFEREQIEDKKLSSKIVKYLMIAVFPVFFGGLFIYVSFISGFNIEDQKEELDIVMEQVEQDIDKKNYELALVKTNKIKWSYILVGEEGKGGEEDTLRDYYVAAREMYVKKINKLMKE